MDHLRRRHHSGLQALHDPDRGAGNGSAIVLEACNGSAAQRFTLNKAHDLVAGGRCVDVIDHGTGDGTKLHLWDCAGTDNQKWSRR